MTSNPHCEQLSQCGALRFLGMAIQHRTDLRGQLAGLFCELRGSAHLYSEIAAAFSALSAGVAVAVLRHDLHHPAAALTFLADAFTLNAVVKFHVVLVLNIPDSEVVVDICPHRFLRYKIALCLSAMHTACVTVFASYFFMARRTIV